MTSTIEDLATTAREACHAAIRNTDFDQVFAITENGNYVGNIAGQYAPEAVNPDGTADATEIQGWQLLLSGYSAQWSYSGPWMHDSETLSDAILDLITSTPGYWVAIYGTYECEYEDEHPETHHECEPHIEGWTMAHKPFEIQNPTTKDAEIGK